MTKKIRAISIIIVSLFLFSGWGMPSFLKKDKANKLYRKEAYPEALDMYQNLQIDYPYKADINYNEGNILYRLGRYNEAENAFKKALQSKDKNIVKNAHYNIGNSLFRQDKLEEAIKSYEETLIIDSTDQDAEYNIELIKKILQKKQQQKQEQKPDKDKKDKQDKKDNPQSKQKTSGGKNEDKEEQQKNEENQENKRKFAVIKNAMSKTGNIEITIQGAKGKIQLTPDNYDIKDIKSILEQAENLLFPGEKRERPTISYRIEEGSVKHVFKTSMQAVIGFNALLIQIDEKKSIDFLEPKTAEAFETFQEAAKKQNYSFTITTSAEKSGKLSIDRTTGFYRTKTDWVNAEFYFYGKITNMGGKGKANFHIVTEDMGTVYVETPKEFLEKYESNPLYKNYAIRATGRQNPETGEIDTSSLKFEEIIPYNPVYDKEYLSKLRQKAMTSWKGISDPDKWLRDLRGYNV